MLVAWTPIEGLRLWWAVRDAEAAALLAPPATWFDGTALALGLGLVAAAGVALVRRRDDAPAYRLLPMAGAVVVFCKLFLLPDVAPPAYFPAPDGMVEAAVVEVARHGQDLAAAGDGTLPVEPEAWTPALAMLGRPPFLLRGAPVPAWVVRVREGCAGPHTERGGEPPGTVFVCLENGRRRGWVTAVSLPVLAGTPELLRGPEGRARAEETGSSPPAAAEYDEAQVGDRAAPLPAP